MALHHGQFPLKNCREIPRVDLSPQESFVSSGIIFNGPPVCQLHPLWLPGFFRIPFCHENTSVPFWSSRPTCFFSAKELHEHVDVAHEGLPPARKIQEERGERSSSQKEPRKKKKNAHKLGNIGRWSSWHGQYWQLWENSMTLRSFQYFFAWEPRLVFRSIRIHEPQWIATKINQLQNAPCYWICSETWIRQFATLFWMIELRPKFWCLELLLPFYRVSSLRFLFVLPQFDGFYNFFFFFFKRNSYITFDVFLNLSCCQLEHFWLRLRNIITMIDAVVAPGWKFRSPVKTVRSLVDVRELCIHDFTLKTHRYIKWMYITFWWEDAKDLEQVRTFFCHNALLDYTYHQTINTFCLSTASGVFQASSSHL